MLANGLSTIYILTALGLSVYGLLGLVTLAFYLRHRHDSFPCPEISDERLPPVTVQLPIFNEQFVVERLIRAAAALDYPRDRLQIQVIDDSTDETTAVAEQLVQHFREQGFQISLVHRHHRQGFKAGALAAALSGATGEYIAIFDADFQPAPDFLRRTVPHFLTNPRLGMTQARWGHLNDTDSALTAVQAIAMDKHFTMEQTVRHRANLFPKFNGAAGVWRRRCLEDAGGWQDDTVCEDLCLSTRAVLRGWQFRFLNDVIAPAELPNSISAYKNQQARWAKGASQCLLKFGREIAVSHEHSRMARLYALLAMSAYSAHLLLLLLLLLTVPIIYFNHQFSSWWILLGIAGIGQPLLFVLGQQVLYPDWRRRLRHFPTLLAVAIGLAPSNSRAILQAFLVRKRPHPFVRTPKGATVTANRHYQLPFDWIILLEMSLALYTAVGLILAWQRHNYGALLFLTLSTFGFGYIAWLGLRERLATR
jgi:cellulose synthase/poly-beta-1,6-N-acetylglucosamine synthase-like glycosyltransferase